MLQKVKFNRILIWLGILKRLGDYGEETGRQAPSHTHIGQFEPVSYLHKEELNHSSPGPGTPHRSRHTVGGRNKL